MTASSAFFLNLIELLAILAVLAAVWLVYEHRDGFAFTATTVTIAACIGSIFVNLYPNVMVSSTSAAYNLTVHNTASAPLRPQGADHRRHRLPAPGRDLPGLDLLRVPAPGQPAPTFQPAPELSTPPDAGARPRHLKRLPRLLVMHLTARAERIGKENSTWPTKRHAW